MNSYPSSTLVREARSRTRTAAHAAMRSRVRIRTAVRISAVFTISLACGLLYYVTQPVPGGSAPATSFPTRHSDFTLQPSPGTATSLARSGPPATTPAIQTEEVVYLDDAQLSAVLAAAGKPVGMIHIGGTRPTVIMEALMPEHTVGAAPISSPGDEHPQPDSTSPPDRFPARGSAW